MHLKIFLGPRMQVSISGIIWQCLHSGKGYRNSNTFWSVPWNWPGLQYSSRTVSQFYVSIDIVITVPSLLFFGLFLFPVRSFVRRNSCRIMKARRCSDIDLPPPLSLPRSHPPSLSSHSVRSDSETTQNCLRRRRFVFLIVDGTDRRRRRQRARVRVPMNSPRRWLGSRSWLLIRRNVTLHSFAPGFRCRLF